jgi:type IV fimbrial biogenesis protein FimT
MAITMLLIMLALPYWQQLQMRAEAMLFIWRFKISLIEARNTAMTSYHSTILCGSSSGNRCDQQWQAGLLLFKDKNSNYQFDQGDERLKFESQSLKYGVVELHAFGVNPSILIFSAEKGTPLASNASFYYCSQNPAFNRALIMGRMGHPRESSDINHDGVHETSSGNPIICSDSRD